MGSFFVVEFIGVVKTGHYQGEELNFSIGYRDENGVVWYRSEREIWFKSEELEM